MRRLKIWRQSSQGKNLAKKIQAKKFQGLSVEVKVNVL